MMMARVMDDNHDFRSVLESARASQVRGRHARHAASAAGDRRVNALLDAT
jgi:hypothetical protein